MSGTASGAQGSSGDVQIKAGTSSGKSAGDIVLSSGDSNNGIGGDVLLTSGGGKLGSGNIDIGTMDILKNAEIEDADAIVSATSGNLSLFSGDAQGAISGDVTLSSGNGLASGNVTIETGSTFGEGALASGNLNIIGGSSSHVGGSVHVVGGEGLIGGNVTISSGIGKQSSGSVQISAAKSQKRGGDVVITSGNAGIGEKGSLKNTKRAAIYCSLRDPRHLKMARAATSTSLRVQILTGLAVM